METEESKELTLAQEETIKKTLEEIRKQDPKKKQKSLHYRGVRRRIR